MPDHGTFALWPPFWHQDEYATSLYPKLFLRVCPSCVQNVMLLSSHPQFGRNISDICCTIGVLSVQLADCHCLLSSMDERRSPIQRKRYDTMPDCGDAHLFNASVMTPGRNVVMLTYSTQALWHQAALCWSSPIQRKRYDTRLHCVLNRWASPQCGLVS